MPKYCTECGKIIKGNPKFCPECGHEQMKNESEQKTAEKKEVLPQSGEIKCPFCGETFNPHAQRDTSTAGNIARGAVFLPWGIVKAVTSKKYVLCPHCKMKIMQG